MPLSILNLKLNKSQGKEINERNEIQMQKESEYLVFSLVLKSIFYIPQTLNRIMIWCAGCSCHCVVIVRKEFEI